MGVLDQITDMKNKGFSEKQILNKLQEQEGLSPKEITDAMNRSNIKSAISDSTQEAQTTEGMQPSIMAPKEEELGGSENYGLAPPKPSPNYQKNSPQIQEMPQEEIYSSAPQYADAGQQYMPQEEYGESYAGYATDTDTMIEISEQVFAEKMKSIIKKIEETLEFKTLAESKLTNMEGRLKRIESQIDNLQSAILEKVGSYGRGLEGVRKEMSMMQDSFGKVVGTLADKKSHSPHVVHHPKETETKKTVVVHKPKTTKTHLKKKISKKKK